MPTQDNNQTNAGSESQSVGDLQSSGQTDTSQAGQSTAPVGQGMSSETPGDLNIPPVMTVSQGGIRGKFRNKKVILAAIFGTIVLVGGIAAGVVLMQNQQDIRRRAATSGFWNRPGYNYCNSNGCDVGNDYRQCIIMHYWSHDKDDPVVNDILICDRCQRAFINTKDCGAEQIDVGCGVPLLTVGYTWIRHDRDCTEPTPTPAPTPTPTPVPTPSPTPVPTPTPTPPLTPTPTPPLTPSPTPVPTPTPTPPATAQCQEIKAYDTSWNLLTSEDLSNLNTGDKVRFAVLGAASSGFFDKAKFSINGVISPEVTTVKPGSDEFYYEYTIKSTDMGRTMEVSAWVHHAALDEWF